MHYISNRNNTSCRNCVKEWFSQINSLQKGWITWTTILLAHFKCIFQYCSLYSLRLVGRNQKLTRFWLLGRRSRMGQVPRDDLALQNPHLLQMLLHLGLPVCDVSLPDFLIFRALVVHFDFDDGNPLVSLRKIFWINFQLGVPPWKPTVRPKVKDFFRPKWPKK